MPEAFDRVRGVKRVFEWVLIAVVAGLGLFHTLMTLLFRRPLDIDFLMYIGTGLAFLFTAAANVPALKQSSVAAWRLCLLVNVCMLAYTLAIVPLLADARALLVSIALAGLLGLAIGDRHPSAP